MNQQTKHEQQLESKIKKMQQVIGEFTLELKKRLKKKRSESLIRTQKNGSLLDAIKAIKSEHPLRGYRRWAYLKFRQHSFIGPNRVHRLMQKSGLFVPRNARFKTTRTPQRSKPVVTEINQYWGMDMTKIKFPAGWKYLHVVKDWCSKEIVGFHFSDTSTSLDWLEALN